MANEKKILAVDDEPDFLSFLCMRLEVSGYSVITAKDGDEALNKARETNPDLIILDLMLPKISGFEVCRMLKFDDAFKHIPIIILSALDQKDDKSKVVDMGADAYFIKPFDFKQLLAKIQEFLAK